MSQNLPDELTRAVRLCADQLGKEINAVYGKKIFNLVENLRQEIKDSEKSSKDNQLEALKKKLKLILKNENSFELAHSFGVFLELINRVENAFRHFRLSQRKETEVKKSPYAIIYVFTAHPTEARNPKIMKLFQCIELLLVDHFASTEEIDSKLGYYLNLILRTSMSPGKKPEVADEAQHIYDIVLEKDVLALQVSLHQKGIVVYFRSWVGGDKDGHPFVNHKTMINSLQLSRDKLLAYISTNLEKHEGHYHQIDHPDKYLIQKFKNIKLLVNGLKKLEKKDGAKIAKFKAQFKDYFNLFTEKLSHECPFLSSVKSLIWLYPTLVLSLEIREDSEMVHQAIKDPKAEISQMLTTLREISVGERSKWYVRGFVLSMCESAKDYMAGIELTKLRLKSLYIPVVPLFETKEALFNATKILEEVFDHEMNLIQHHHEFWESRFEVMLGYSDSSKESGVFAGKWSIAKGIHLIDQYLRDKGLTPVFFHGSGGSIARGGGSIREQIQWWPKSAVNIFKVTIQGEMVARHFSDVTILKSQIQKITDELSRIKPVTDSSKFNLAMDRMSELSRDVYQALFHEQKFINLVQNATPYLYLDQLKIGSRPSKRSKSTSNELKLRAIPWILCWTQTRLLLPNWYGIGTAWKNLEDQHKNELIKGYEHSDYLKSFIKVLGFSLAKIELNIFKLYVESNLSKSEAAEMIVLIENELKLTETFFKEVSKESDFLFFRPWLADSIRLRSRMIHPLNLIQIKAMKEQDFNLLRETVTGIACGMMTTG
ncbi:MAG: phosphoenolpyruvate carboxylase [Bacteriovoracaceae bacterium]